MLSDAFGCGTTGIPHACDPNVLVLLEPAKLKGEADNLADTLRLRVIAGRDIQAGQTLSAHHGGFLRLPDVATQSTRRRCSGYARDLTCTDTVADDSGSDARPSLHTGCPHCSEGVRGGEQRLRALVCPVCMVRAPGRPSCLTIL
eukprot:SAG25_NODE_28_length_20925_cov_13.342839_11_plen_145_part_00